MLKTIYFTFHGTCCGVLLAEGRVFTGIVVLAVVPVLHKIWHENPTEQPRQTHDYEAYTAKPYNQEVEDAYNDY